MPPKGLAPPPPPSKGAGKGAVHSRQASGYKVASSRAALTLQEQLAAKSLRKVSAEDIHDTSGAVQASGAGFDTPEAISDYQKYMQKFNIECWLDALGDATFATELVPISIPEARALILLHKGGSPQNAAALATKALDSMALRLQEAMQIVTTREGEGCFVKTSCRSAKDHAELAEIRALCLANLELLHMQDENAKLVALSYASMTLLCMTVARRVMDIFVASERCWHDMELALAQQDSWTESLVARAWVHLEPDMEFRCFVSNNQLTAVSQYRHLVCFPRLLALREKLIEGLTDFFQVVIRPRLTGCFPDNRYVADLAVELVGGDIGNIMSAEPLDVVLGRWWCIEVNPFYETTDGCLFSWGRERDLLQGIQDTSGGAEFRLRERPAKGALSLVYGCWKEALTGIGNDLPDE